MALNGLSRDWAERFGLAAVPLWEADQPSEGEHAVLLDGGYGSFALSITEDRLWQGEVSPAWAWSSDLPHHITVTRDHVGVVRWDKPKAELLSRGSVERQLDAFYDYLAADRVRSSQRVVDHMLQLYRRIRSLTAHAVGTADDRSIDAFLGFIDLLIERTTGTTAPQSQHSDVVRGLDASALDQLLEDAEVPMTGGGLLRLYPSLAVRHAGSRLFQEAHFEFLRAPTKDLFDYVGPAESGKNTRGGAHFTPPALARSLVEQTLDRLADLHGRGELTISDPACGSGAFLHEALRTLRRRGYRGRITLIGRDISRSAISMARYVLGHARADWTGRPEVLLDLVVADSLAEPPAPSDVVLMNPPFVAWASLGAEQREQMRAVLGQRLGGRGDLSMAFTTLGLDAVKDGGAMGVLLPASLLSLQAAEEWRRDLASRAHLCFLAAFGDYSLFSYAMVQVTAAVFQKSAAAPGGTIRALVAADDPEATGQALRALRRSLGTGAWSGEGGSWRISDVPEAAFVRRPVWRLSLAEAENAIADILAGGAVRVADVFDVRQGVRTGLNKAFLLTDTALSGLPLREQAFFRPAIVNQSIEGGRIRSDLHIFYPYRPEGLTIHSEAELRHLMPQYHARHLLPAQNRLKSRASILRANRTDWWGLSERRSWALDTTPRVVSKYFGSSGGFGADVEAAFVVVQGFAWIFKTDVAVEGDEPGAGTDEEVALVELAYAYAALFNSASFALLLEVFCPVVAGGQYDLSPRYVDEIPVPNLPELAKDEATRAQVLLLAGLGRAPRLNDIDWRLGADRLARRLYGDSLDRL